MAAGIDFDWHANELVHRKILLKLTTTEAQHRRVFSGARRCLFVCQEKFHFLLSGE